MNVILDSIIESRGGHYCHAIEVNEVYELECVVEGIIAEFPDLPEAEYLEFFNSIEVYCLNDDNEQAVHAFSFNEYIKDTI